MSSTSSSLRETEFKQKPLGGTETVLDINHLSQLEHFSDGSLSAEDIEIIASHIEDYTVDEALKIIEDALSYHKNDPCLSYAYYGHLMSLAKGPSEFSSTEEWETILKFDAFIIHDWSIYPEVRSVTRPIDEEEYENYENLRVYILSIGWSCAGSVLSTFFAVRFPSISLGQTAIQILIAYTGRAIERVPDFSFPVGFGRRIHWGKGRWNYKEQILCGTGMTTGDQSPYSQFVVLAMANDYFYGFQDAKANFGFTVLLTLSTNLMGFGLAGIFRIFLVYPVRMLWYICLPGMRLARILTEEAEVERENVNGWKLKGWECFWLFALAEFCWYWITDFLFTFLSTMDWVAWIAPNNNNMLSIAGVNGGLGFNPFPSLDPNIIGVGTMVSPFYSTFVSTVIGMGLSSFVLIGIYYMNISWTGYLPINTNMLYDNTGQPYSVRKVLDKDHKLDETALRSYSLPFWSAGNLIRYGAYFAFYPAMIVHASLNYGDVLLHSFKVFVQALRSPGKSLSKFDDRFTRAQRKYKEVPEWWYITFLLVCIALGIVTVEVYKFTNTPVWTIFFGIGLSAVFMIPSGVLYATTNTSIVINVLYELIIGLTNSGNGTALMVSKAYATNFMAEADNFINNLKTAHYVGIAPRAMFRVQMVNCILNSFVQAGLVTWQSTDGAIEGMCSPTSLDKFTCQDVRTYFNAAVQWGTIGPSRVFRELYPRMRYTFLFGALFPIPFWALRKFALARARKQGWGKRKDGASTFRNSSIVRSIVGLEWSPMLNEVLILSGALSWAPSNFMYTWPSVYVGLCFQVIIPRYYPRWWQKYNYLIYAGISVGIGYSALIMFFATEYHHIVNLNWWGNVQGISLTPNAMLTVPEGETFGPSSWT